MLIPFVTLATILAGVGALLYWLLPYPMAIRLLRPPRMTDGKAIYLLKRLSPADLGMAYEEVSFQVRDEQTGEPLNLAAWWMPNPRPTDRTVVLVHGYADAKVGAIAWGPLWRELGYNLLAIDLRAHGSSGGINVTAGYWERHDVSQVLDQIHTVRPNQTRHIVLFGISLGAAVVAAVAAMRDDLTGVLLESPYSDYPTAVTSHANLMGMPGPSFVRRAIRRAERISGADFSQVAPVQLIPQAKCPVMVISPGEDPLVGPALFLLQEAVAKRGADGSTFWKVDNAYHVEALLADPAEYRRRVEQFLTGITEESVVEHHQMRRTL